MAEVLLRRALPDAEVTSAGTMYRGGAPASEGSVRAMAARGLVLDAHVSRPLEPAMLAADLILGMARHHVRDTVVAEPSAFPRTFTLKELVRRGESVGPRRPDQPLGEWLAEVHAGRTSSALLGDSPDDDVADPIGRPDAEYERTAVELEGLVERLAALIR
jgi:protein-tyrosine phosphatase